MNNCCAACKALTEKGLYACSSSTCRCHTNKGEKKHSEVCSFKSNDAPCSCPTQPERSWWKRFDETFPQTVSMGYETIEIEALKEFIRTEIEASYKRGQMKGNATGNFKGYMEGLKDGKKAVRANVLEELEGKLPPETKEGDDLPYYFKQGGNDYRQQVLNIIKSIKGE